MGKLRAYQGTCVGVRGHLYGTGSLLPPLCRFQGFFQGSQVCIASSLSTKPIPSIQQILFLLQVVVIHQLPTFFLGVGSLYIVSIKHGCGAGGGLFWNQPIQGTHLMVTPEETTKAEVFQGQMQRIT